jgi:peptidoglycan/LPS O-acetylase OafA/YrhL
LDSRKRSPTDGGWRYLAKRLIRLYPGYAFAVALYLLTLHPPNAARVAWEHFTLFLVLQDTADVYALNPAFWCMPVFVIFYALVACLPKGFEPKGWQVIALWLSPLALAALQVPQWVALNAQALSLSLMIILYLNAFALGAWIMHRASNARLLVGPVVRIGTLICLTLIVVLGYFYKTLERQWGVPVLLFQYLMIGLFALLLASLLAMPARVSPQSPQPQAWWLGLSELGFGVFLYHNLVPHWLSTLRLESLLTALGLASVAPTAGLLLTVLGALLLSFVSLHALERPLVRLTARFVAKAPSPPAAASGL